MPRKISQGVAPAGTRTLPRVVSSPNRAIPKNGQMKYQTPSAHQTGIRPNMTVSGQTGSPVVRAAKASGSSTPGSTSATALARLGARPRMIRRGRRPRPDVSDTPSPLLRHPQHPLAGHQPQDDRHGDQHPLLPGVEPDDRRQLADRLGAAAARSQREGDLAADPGQAATAAGQLGM